jgi:hypothetical protein
MINMVLAGQLLGTAFACGLNLYATVALLGLAVRNDWITGLPAGLGGLGNGVIIGSAILLYIVELIADRVPIVGATWEAVHTLIRPAAAAALAVLALQGMPIQLVIAAAIAAAAVALAVHGSKAGLRMIVATRRKPRPALSWAVSVVEDVLAVGVAATALLFPETAVVVVAVALGLLLLAGPRLCRAALLGLHAVVSRGRGFFGHSGWRSRDQLPRSLRAAIPVEPLGRSPARAAAAGVAGLGGVAAYRSGWLVFTCDGPRFVYRALFRSRCTALPPITNVSVRKGFVTDAIYVTANGARRPRTFTIFLLKDGPPPHIAAAELRPEDSR